MEDSCSDGGYFTGSWVYSGFIAGPGCRVFKSNPNLWIASENSEYETEPGAGIDYFGLNLMVHVPIRCSLDIQSEIFLANTGKSTGNTFPKMPKMRTVDRSALVPGD